MRHGTAVPDSAGQGGLSFTDEDVAMEDWVMPAGPGSAVEEVTCPRLCCTGVCPVVTGVPPADLRPGLRAAARAVQPAGRGDGAGENLPRQVW